MSRASSLIPRSPPCPIRRRMRSEAPPRCGAFIRVGGLNANAARAKPLYVLALPQSLVHLRAAPKSLKDLTGQRLVAPTQITALTAQYMGAQPITFSSPEG